MKRMVSFLGLFLMATGFCYGQQKNPVKIKPRPEDQIKQFWFVMLTKGPHRDQDSAEAAKIQEGHIANITKLYNEGKLKVAGPFGDDGDWVGLFIFDCKTKKEVEKLVKSDPAIVAGRLEYDIHPWYTSPAGSFAPGVPKKTKP